MRALGSHIKGTNGKSQGVVPFLKVVNDTAVAVNQGGKRKGAVCSYLETWHLDIEEFLELRKNTGDDRRRTHDMNTANWIPDLFMKRVMEGGDWTLFSPSDVPDLHDKWGRKFEEAYTRYEDKAARGELKLYKKIPAVQLWRKMLSMLFETGHPWITFKDACNVRSPQSHVGTVHSSNLCTEITLNTSEREIAVCNLGSVNLLAHMKQVDRRSVGARPREAQDAPIQHRDADARQRDRHQLLRGEEGAQLQPAPPPGGPGHHGLPGLPAPAAARRTRSDDAMTFADRSMEAVCYYAYLASTEMAEERGRYRSYNGSLWDRGIMPQDSLKLLAEERGGYVEIDESSTMDWDALRARIKQHGMRNSNCIAIAPTATISNIVGVGASIEPEYQNIYVKSNLSGEFTVVNEHLVAELKKPNLWDEVMVAGSQVLRRLARQDRPRAGRTCASSTRPRSRSTPSGSSRRARAGRSGSTRRRASTSTWPARRARSSTRPTSSPGSAGLKTTYYLRTLAATSAEKSTGQGGELNAVSTSGGAERVPQVT